ncbi:MAG: DUF1592 domain-containing protein [Myxococcota bacterium]
MQKRRRAERSLVWLTPVLALLASSGCGLGNSNGPDQEEVAASGIRPVSPTGRLTSGEYLATLDAAFPGPAPTIELPPDGTDGVFTTNAGSQGIADFSGYVMASEAIGDHYAPALMSACDWNVDVEGCTDDTFGPILFELFRGADLPADIDELTSLVEAALDEGARLEVALAGAVSRALLDDRFLFHIEQGGAPGDDSDELLLTDEELAARMSYVIVDAPPDESLRHAAAQGLAESPEALWAQSQRLFSDPRAREEMWRFTREWLAIAPQTDEGALPPQPPGDECDFTSECVALYGATANDCVNSRSNQSYCLCGTEPCAPPPEPPRMALGASMDEETRRFVEYVVFDSQAPLSELFTANYSFINATLAEHYGVPAPETDWERYEFPPEAQRRGILTHASFLAANGKSERDVSWIFRGKIVYERLLCGELAPPPPGVIDREVPNRETTEPCKVCHEIMDPIGRIFDGYDETGALVPPSVDDAVVSVGSSFDGTYTDATEFADTVGFSDELTECFTTMWFRHALSRKPRDVDASSVAQVREELASGGSIRAAALALMSAPAFRTLYRAPEDQVCE